MTITRQPGIRTSHDRLVSICSTIAGRPLTVEKHLNANNDEEYVNCFQLFGTVELFRIYGIVTDNTVMNSCDELCFNLYDGTNKQPITANSASLSGANVDSYFLKLYDAAEPLVVSLNNDSCQVKEHVENSISFYQCTITQRAGHDTYIQLHYRTTDTPIDAKVNIYAWFEPLDGGILEAV